MQDSKNLSFKTANAFTHKKQPTFPEELKLRAVHRVSDDLYID